MNIRYENIDALRDSMKKLTDNPINYNNMRTNKNLFETTDYKVNY